jgi:hypothetical protein
VLFELYALWRATSISSIGPEIVFPNMGFA